MPAWLVFSGSVEGRMTRLHDSLTVIDGLVISKWSRAVFVDMRNGGLTAANCTCSIWEGFVATMRNIAQWKRWFADNADLITPVRTTADVHRAKREGRTGIILGFQTTSALEDQIGFIADHGGFVGVTMFPPFLARGNESTVEDYIAAIDYVIRIAGEDNVGIGTDFTQDQDDRFFEYLCHDKGYGWRVTGPLGEVVNPAGIRTIGDFPNLTAAMEHAGWPEAKIRRVMGENWLRILAEVWGE